MRRKTMRPFRVKIALTIIIIVVVSLLCLGAVFLINSDRINRTLSDSTDAGNP